MPFFNSPDKYGNLYVEFKIVFPDKLNKEQYNKLDEIFKDEKINIIDDLSIDMEKCYLEDYNESETNPHYKGGKKEDHKEDDKEDDENNIIPNCPNQ